MFRSVFRAKFGWRKTTGCISRPIASSRRYVTISRGRRGIRIFTPDKQQLRENVTRPGHRPLALEFAAGFAPHHRGRLWNRLRGYMLRFGQRAADRFCRFKALADNTINPKTNMSKKSPECYTTDPNAECLRVEVSPGHSLLLPHDELLSPNSRARKRNRVFGWSLQSMKF